MLSWVSFSSLSFTEESQLLEGKEKMLGKKKHTDKSLRTLSPFLVSGSLSWRPAAPLEMGAQRRSYGFHKRVGT